MGRKEIPQGKKNIVSAVHDIIRDYLYDESESYASIKMYFETENGESQEKWLVWGEPSEETPEEYIKSGESLDELLMRLKGEKNHGRE